MSDPKARKLLPVSWLLLAILVLLPTYLCSATCCQCITVCSDSFTTCESCQAFCLANDEVVTGFHETGSCAAADACDQGACCTPDGCEMTTRLDCTLRGGSFLMGSACSACATATPASKVISIRAEFQNGTTWALCVPIRAEFGISAGAVPGCACEDVGIPTPFAVGQGGGLTLIAPQQIAPAPLNGASASGPAETACFLYWRVDGQENVAATALVLDSVAGDEAVAVYGVGATTAPVSDESSATWIVADDGEHPDYVRVRWSEVEGATAYTVYRSSNESGPYTPLSEPQAEIIYRDRTAEAPIVYWYRVEACIGAGCVLSDARDSGYAACSCSLRPTTVGVPGDECEATVRVNTTDGCSWTAELDTQAHLIVSGESGTGDGKVEIYLGTRNTPDTKVFHVTVLGERATIVWGCYPYRFAPYTFNLESYAYSSVTTDLDVGHCCYWDVDTDVNWITILGLVGDGTIVRFSVDANPNPGQSRTGHIYVVEEDVGRIKGYARCEVTITQN